MKRRHFLDLSMKSAVLAGFAAKPFRLLAESEKSSTGLVLDDGFIHHHISPGHPESPQRYQAIKQEFVEQDLIARTSAISPRDDVDQWLRLVHTRNHIASIKKLDNHTHHDASLATAGILAAVDQVCSGRIRNAFCATRPPGHHARNTGQEEGFCYYNHVAIAARYAQKNYPLKKILIVDWDYHHGNGTEETFYADPSVLFFSTHDYNAYPGTGNPAKRGVGKGEGYNINVHMDCGAGDEDFIKVFNRILLPAAEVFAPDLILISAGFDSRKEDLLGCHEVTDQGFSHLTQIVMQIAERHCDGRIVSLLEGGYNIRGNAKAAAAHLNTLML